MGAEVIISGNTNRRILDSGISKSVDEACLPVKVYIGHAAALIDKVDYLFVPRFISISKNEYICPGFGGLPDIIRRTIKEDNSVILIDPEVNLRKSLMFSRKAAFETAKYLTRDFRTTKNAYGKAVRDYRLFREKTKNGMLPSDYFSGSGPPLKEDMDILPRSKETHIRIAVIGHPYVVYDKYINMDLLNKLKKLGAKTYTVEMAEERNINNEAGKLTKPMFWNYGRKAIGSSMYFAKNMKPDGIIYVSSFGCGIDSFVCNMIERRIRASGDTSFIIITLDEHSGEAGLNTRLEAFIDLIRWKKQNESNISAFG